MGLIRFVAWDFNEFSVCVPTCVYGSHALSS